MLLSIQNYRVLCGIFDLDLISYVYNVYFAIIEMNLAFFPSHELRTAVKVLFTKICCFEAGIES